MAQGGLFRETIFDSTGAPVTSGGTADIRIQGATCKAQASRADAGSLTITVYNPGRFASGQQCDIYESDGETSVATSLSITNVTATTVVVTTTGALTVDVGDRLVNSAVSGRATVYKDAELTGGNEKTNPLTVDDNGMVWAWIEANYYDVLISDGSSTKVLFDVVISGDKRTTNGRSSATVPVYLYDTEFAISDDHLLARWAENTDPKFTIFGSGKVTMEGQLDCNGGLDVEGNSSITGTLADLTGLTVASGSVSLPTGSIASAALAANSASAAEAVVTDTNKFTGSTSSTAWEDVTNLSISITPDSTTADVHVMATVHIALDNSGNAGIRLQNDTDATTIDEAYSLPQGTIPDNTDKPQHIKLHGIETGMSGAKTYKVQVKHYSGGASDAVNVRGDLVTSRLSAWQMKK